MAKKKPAPVPLPNGTCHRPQCGKIADAGALFCPYHLVEQAELQAATAEAARRREQRKKDRAERESRLAASPLAVVGSHTQDRG